MLNRQVLAAAALLLLAGCSNDLIFRDEDLDLDAGDVQDVARLIPEPPASPIDRPVVIAVHGYGSTTYETRPVAEYLRARGCLVSQVLLDGHGTTVRDLNGRSYEEWGGAIAREYDRLVAMGFSDIALLGTSAGSSLSLDLLARGRLEPIPRCLIFVSPLVQFGDRRAGFLPLFKRLGIKGTRFEPGGSSPGHWYPTRPIASLFQLKALADRCRRELERGLELPAGSRVLIIHSKRDESVALAGVELLAGGLSGARVELLLVDSEIHVPIKPIGSDREWTAEERTRQEKLLERIHAFLRE
jgi:carboxylesterase